jgi:hypothetical protein
VGETSDAQNVYFKHVKCGADAKYTYIASKLLTKFSLSMEQVLPIKEPVICISW